MMINLLTKNKNLFKIFRMIYNNTFIIKVFLY